MAIEDPKLFDRVARLRLLGLTTPPDDEAFQQKEVDIGAQIDCYGGVGQRMEFEIEHNLSKHPNRCRITVTNLNESSRSFVKNRPLRVELEAGYKDAFSAIFKGDVTFSVSTLDGPNWKTVLEVGDGDRVIASARTNKSYKPGVTLGSVLEDQLKAVGQKLPENIRNSSIFKKVMSKGYAAIGQYRDELDNLLKPTGYTWSIQDGQPQILREDETDVLVFDIDERHGMIGSPEFGHPPRKKKPPTITVRMALYPSIRPGHVANVHTRDVQGTFKVVKVKHSGDTHGTDWKTEIEIAPREKSVTKNGRPGFSGK